MHYSNVVFNISLICHFSPVVLKMISGIFLGIGIKIKFWYCDNPNTDWCQNTEFKAVCATALSPVSLPLKRFSFPPFQRFLAWVMKHPHIVHCTSQLRYTNVSRLTRDKEFSLPFTKTEQRY